MHFAKIFCLTWKPRQINSLHIRMMPQQKELSEIIMKNWMVLLPHRRYVIFFYGEVHDEEYPLKRYSRIVNIQL